MIPALNLATIVAMALVTYGTRIGGYLFLRDREIGARLRYVLETAPGCVLLAVIAPYFAPERLADLLALGVTILAATRLPMLATVAIAVGAASLLRHLVG